MTEWQLREVPHELRERYLAEGLWDDDTFSEFISRHVDRHPDLAVRVWSDAMPYDGTVGDIDARARRFAGGLASIGVRAGDVVVYQLPNWSEAIVALWGGFHLGCVMVPIIHFYGAREVEFICRQVGATALVTVDRYGPTDHLANLAGFGASLPDLEHVIVLRNPATGDGAGDRTEGLDVIEFDVLADHDPLPMTGTAVASDSPAMVGYTSGTTALPKGVIHSHRSLLAEVRQLASTANIGDRPSLMASPVAHMTGMLGVVLGPIHRGVALHLMDGWDPGRALQIMVEAQVSSGSGATIFLTSLLDHPDFSPTHVALMERVGLGGARIPAAVAERAESMGIQVTRAYGSTEHPSISGSDVGATQAQRNRTDGRPSAGVEIRLVRPDGTPAEVGEEGEIHSRGPDLCVGYTDPALTAAVFDADGWYRTGDVGVLDAEGYLEITDRTSDVIIRGGLNLSAAEIEELLMTHPAVAECAVVAAPDERLGERACAYVRLRPGGEGPVGSASAEPDLAGLQRHLAGAGLAKQKWIEQLVVVDEFPRTPSGKIRKVELRRQLRDS